MMEPLVRSKQESERKIMRRDIREVKRRNYSKQLGKYRMSDTKPYEQIRVLPRNNKLGSRLHI